MHCAEVFGVGWDKKIVRPRICVSLCSRETGDCTSVGVAMVIVDCVDGRILARGDLRDSYSTGSFGYDKDVEEGNVLPK